MRAARAALTSLLAVACSSPNAPDETRVLGEIAGVNPDDPHLEVPATAERGVPFPVSVRTYGNGCYRAGDTEVRAAGPSAVEVVPYDFTRLGVVCPDILKSSVHTATVRFDAAGPALVRVRGRHGSRGAEIVVEREVIVQ